MLRNTLSILCGLILVSLGIDSALAQNNQFQREQLTDRDGTVFIWQGIVSSMGDETPTIDLDRDERYYFEVSRSVYYGKWQENRNRSLVNDACYEFNATRQPNALPIFQNSLNISACDGRYHPDHVYRSPLFSGNDNGIKFWIYDTDYRDNTGGLWVQIFQVKSVKKKSQTSLCTCEDLHRTGIFSVVSGGQVIKRGLGFSECLDYTKTLDQCHATNEVSSPKPVTHSSLCTCEDLHRTGTFSVVRDGQVIKRKLGFSECLDYTKTLDQCRAR